MAAVRTSLLSLCVLAAAFALVVGTGAAAPAATPRNGCGLLRKAEVRAALREPVARVEGGRSSSGELYCNWTGSDHRIFTRGITLVAARDHVLARYAAYRTLLSSKKPVRGIGVVAITDGNVILARSRRAMVQVGPMYARSHISAVAVRALAKKALARA